jgi:MYXO-CTERM domain-containing protein
MSANATRMLTPNPTTLPAGIPARACFGDACDLHGVRDDGCGCRSSSPGSLVLALGLVAFVARRREPRRRTARSATPRIAGYAGYAG